MNLKQRIEVVKSNYHWILVIVLVITNVLTYQSNSWYRQQFNDNLALTQDYVSSTKFALEDILDAGKVTHDDLWELRKWAEMASTQAARVTYLDEHHFDLWSSLSGSMALLEAFTEDFMDVVDKDEALILDDYSFSKLSEVHEKLDEVTMELFPDNIPEGSNPWGSAQYDRMSRASSKIRGLKSRVARCWLIIPHLTDSSYVPPEAQAEQFLVDRLGRTYFEAYFANYTVGFNTGERENWLVGVTYHYRIQVGDYDVLRRVSFRFDTMGKLIDYECVPGSSDLQPFTVTRQQAVETAKGLVNEGYVEMDAEINWVKKTINGTRVDRYLWSVNFYHTERWSTDGRATRVLIDPKDGEVIDVDKYGLEAIS